MRFGEAAVVLSGLFGHGQHGSGVVWQIWEGQTWLGSYGCVVAGSAAAALVLPGVAGHAWDEIRHGRQAVFRY
jgi:hypothetical protein